MAEIVRETVTTQNNGPRAAVTTESKNVATGTQTIEYVIYFVFGVLEILLGFRLILKIMGASLASGFVKMIYGLTGIFVAPFEGIFRKAYSQGIEAGSVLEPSTIVAIIVYAVLLWGVIKLVQISSGERQMDN